jgi:hypothetical protein
MDIKPKQNMNDIYTINNFLFVSAVNILYHENVLSFAFTHFFFFSSWCLVDLNTDMTGLKTKNNKPDVLIG